MVSKDSRAINADDLRLVGHYLDDPKHTFVYSYTTLRTTLDDLGPVWGNDDNGLKFAETYIPSRDKMFSSLTDVTGGFDTLQTDIYGTADTYEQVEKDNAG